MTTELQRLYSLLLSTLRFQSPVLSGNMKSGIHIKSINEDEVEIVIEAPFYDMKEYLKTNKIIKTGANYGGITDYAYWVNKLGGFATHNESEGWVNRVVERVCDTIANMYGWEVNNEL